MADQTNMGFGYGLESSSTCFKRKFRWLMFIEGVSASGINALPPSKSSRPGLTFKEMSAEHLNETIYFPSKPDWKPVQLVLYDLVKNNHPVLDWIKKAYDPKQGTWKPSGNVGKDANGNTSLTNTFKRTAWLCLYDGCGFIIEMWVFENAYPQQVEFGELDMGDSSYLTANLTLRYDRAYIVDEKEMSTQPTQQSNTASTVAVPG